MALPPDYFNWKGLQIRQDNTVHKVGTDALTLGSWIPTIISHAHTVLDVGTGTGILALCMARSFPEAIIHGIDIDKPSIALALCNADRNKLRSRVDIMQEDVLESRTHRGSYDLVISNPPYHWEQIFPKEEYKRTAKHIPTSVDEWVQGCVDRLVYDGHLMLIVPYASASHWIRSANELGLHNQHRLDIFSFKNDAAPKRSLLHLKRQLTKPAIHRLIIYNDDKTFTSEYIQLTGIGQQP